MQKKYRWLISSVLVLTLAIFFSFIFDAPANASDLNTERIIRVSGEAVLTVAPDQAIITLSIETIDTNPKVAVEKNARITSNVIASLKEIGLKDEQLKTGTYTLYSYTDYPYPERTKEDQLAKYRANNTVIVTTQDLDNVGKIIDTAIKAGANNVQSVRFELKDAEDITLKALQAATRQAKAKAEAIADGAGVSITGIKSITEEGYGYTPFRASYTREMAAADAAVSTPIIPGDVEIHARVVVEYTFCQ